MKSKKLKSKLRKIGNSLCVIIPKSILLEFGIGEGDFVNIEMFEEDDEQFTDWSKKSYEIRWKKLRDENE